MSEKRAREIEAICRKKREKSTLGNRLSKVKVSLPKFSWDDKNDH